MIFDTSVLVSMERGARRSFDAIADDDDVAIAAVTAAELLVGVEMASGKRRTTRATLVDDVLSEIPIEPYTLATARAHATLLAWTAASGSPRGAHDLLIAATAVATRRVVLTSDARGFTDLPGVDLLSVTG